MDILFGLIPVSMCWELYKTYLMYAKVYYQYHRWLACPYLRIQVPKALVTIQNGTSSFVDSMYTCKGHNIQ